MCLLLKPKLLKLRKFLARLSGASNKLFITGCKHSQLRGPGLRSPDSQSDDTHLLGDTLTHQQHTGHKSRHITNQLLYPNGDLAQNIQVGTEAHALQPHCGGGCTRQTHNIQHLLHSCKQEALPPDRHPWPANAAPECWSCQALTDTPKDFFPSLV